MLPVTTIKERKEALLKGLKTRNFPADDIKIVDEIIALDNLRKATQTENDELLAQSNKLSKEIGNLYKLGKREEAESIKNEVAQLKERSKELSNKLEQSVRTTSKLVVENTKYPSSFSSSRQYR